ARAMEKRRFEGAVRRAFLPPARTRRATQHARRLAPSRPPSQSAMRVGRMPTVYIETYGCQMNVADTELMLGQLTRHGYARTPTPEAADVILLNTCAIREHAEARVIGRLGGLARYKRRRPDVRLGATGCRAQHLRDALRTRAPHVDLLAGPDG